MRITVLGSTGRTGLHVLREAHRRGHELTAFTRRPEALPDWLTSPATGVDPGADTATTVPPGDERDPVTGQPPNSAAGDGRDPVAGQPLNSITGDRRDPIVGQPMNVVDGDGRDSVTERPVNVVGGDGRDPGAVGRAVAGADAVIAIVAGPRKGPHHAAAVARTLTEAMAAHGVRRLVVTSAYPMVADRPRIPIAVLRRLFAGAYADAAEMERTVEASELDWTIVRLNRLTEGPARGGVVTSRGLLAAPAPMTRADAAVTLLDIVADATAFRAAVNTCGRH